MKHSASPSQNRSRGARGILWTRARQAFMESGFPPTSAVLPPVSAYVTCRSRYLVRRNAQKVRRGMWKDEGICEKDEGICEKVQDGNARTPLGRRCSVKAFPKFGFPDVEPYLCGPLHAIMIEFDRTNSWEAAGETHSVVLQSLRKGKTLSASHWR